MKILYHHRIRSKDGQAVHLEELIRALEELGHDVSLVGPAQFAEAEFGHEPSLLAKAKQLLPKAVYEVAELCYNVGAFVRLWRAIRRIRPDFIYERYNLYSLAGALFRTLAGTPLLLEVNAPLARERREFGGLAFPGLARRLEAWTWRSADFVLPVTKVLAEDVARAGLEEGRIVVIPNGIRTGDFDASSASAAERQRLGLEGKLVIGFAGFARSWHGLDALADLLAHRDVPENLHALMIGEGPGIDELKARCAALGVSHRATFAGLIGRERIAQAMAAFDIAILPDCVTYCSPLKLFEYMALGKAIVAPDQANIREILTHEGDALLFAPRAKEQMAQAILRLTASADLRHRLGRAARALIDVHGYTWHRNAERVCALAPQAMARRRAGAPVQGNLRLQ